MEFHPETLAVCVDKTECMASETVHVAIRTGDTSVAHCDGNLMQCFGKTAPEIPVVVRAAQVSVRITFYSMVQIGKFQRVAEKEDRSVISDQIPIAFLGVKFHSESTDIPLGIGCSALTGNGGKSHKHFCFFPYFGENFRFSIWRNVMRNGKCAKCTRPFGMHTPLRNYLAIEMSEFLQKPHVLQHHWSAWTSGHRILIIANRGSCNRGHWFLIFFVFFFL
ncbi:hypothetical protein SDC9_113026 [bioreactor metagenome]|uniref:Uncharacterized protein n=1 Tax=bioreactor metagenome TaxID=1076179 RepID=A0A645BKX9_9ZZZZ